MEPALDIASPAPAIELSVLTYNVEGLPWPFARKRGQALHRIGEGLALMRREGRQPDVVLIQEGFRGEMAGLVRESGYRHWARGPGRGGRLATAGLYVLSDAPIQEVRKVAYRSCAGLDCAANKGAMMVRLTFEGAPTPIDIVNTHLNSRKASWAPKKQRLKAHNRQMRKLNTFVEAHRTADIPMLVGGDFNVKGAPQRYDYGAQGRPYVVVSEFCSQPGADCWPDAPDAAAKPWLASQDLQAFVQETGVDVRPVATETLFAATSNGRALSDHAGYLVRYKLSWTR